MSKTNGLAAARSSFEKREWSKALEICEKYKAVEDCEYDFDDIDVLGQDGQEIALIRLKCMFKCIDYEKYGAKDESINYEEIFDSIKSAIIEELCIFVIGEKDNTAKFNLFKAWYKDISEFLLNEYIYLLNIYIENSKISYETDLISYYQLGALKTAVELIEGFDRYLTLELSDFAEENNLEIGYMDYINKITSKTTEGYIDVCDSILSDINDETDDFPNYVNKKVLEMYLGAESAAKRALLNEKESGADVRIPLLKKIINIKCDLLNAIIVVPENGTRFSLLVNADSREERYSDILEYEEEIRKYDNSYNHPTVNREYYTNSSNSSGGCYVATAVYGSYDCPEVWTLRRYRDYTLAETWCGRVFIKTYYAISPTLVKWFGHTKWFKKMWKGRLDKMVSDLQSKGVGSTPYNDRNW